MKRTTGVSKDRRPKADNHTEARAARDLHSFEAAAKPDAVSNVVEHARQVWEEKAVGLIYDDYQHNVRIHASLGERYGRDALVAEATELLAAFPDGRLHDDATIWEDRRGLYLSHGVTRVAHNTGHSVFGPPTGKRVRYREVTDYLVRGDRVVEVWRVHDGLTLARQLGLSVRAAVETLAGQTPPPHRPGSGDPKRHLGQEPPDAPPRPAPDDGVEALARWTWHEIWNRRRLDRISQGYAPNYLFFGPSGRRFRTRKDYAAFVLGVLAAFPDAVVGLERLTCQGDREEGRIAVRWRLFGTHDGPGPYGLPSGRRVSILGTTHQHLRRGEFIKEWTVFDELALLVQLRGHDDLTPEQSALKYEPKDWSCELSDV